jgi:N-acetylglutamate synthase-like GNAT family acetyltransferase
LYIEDNNEIIGAVTTKDMDEEKQKITLSIIAVDKNYRGKV